MQSEKLKYLALVKIKDIFSINILLLLLACIVSLSSCDELDNIESGLSEEEIAEGLRSALTVGTDTSVSILSALDGYYKDDLVKILLPEEADILINNVGKIPGGQVLLDETILAINRSAEDAANSAAPIFWNAIANITFNDAKNILNGADDAATGFLKTNTQDSLLLLFKPQINESLSKELIPGISAERSYASLVTKYNAVANNSFGILKPIAGNSLSEHTTQKALDGLFIKVALEEGRIRNKAEHRVNEILRKVFGS